MLAVSIKNLSHKINNKPILNNVNFELKKDSIACILGPSGSGKTTLLKLIAGLDKVQNGEIFINEQEVSSANKHLATEKRKIGYLFQDYALFPHLTVKENLKYPINFKNSIYTINDIIDVKGMKAQGNQLTKLKVKEIVLTHPIEGKEPWPKVDDNESKESEVVTEDASSQTMEWDIKNDSKDKNADDQISLF